MRSIRHSGVLCVALLAIISSHFASASDAQSYSMQSDVNQLYALANQARASYGLAPLRWDPALAASAMQHCVLMARASQIEHRYRNEADVPLRASQSGAHFSLIEENIASGPYASGIQQAWMNSPEHRANLLNPSIDRVGLAVVSRNGQLYAVADYARAVIMLTQAQVESAVASQLRARGVVVLDDAIQARAYCASNGSYHAVGGPRLMTRWQSSDMTQLPSEVLRELSSGAYHQAAVGSCLDQDQAASFTSYRVAVILYAAQSSALPAK
jgi:hypothetical protein